MWDSRIEMMCNMRRANLVMEEVDDTPWIELVVGTVDGVERPLHKVMIVIRKMWYINICVLKPVIFHCPREMRMINNDKDVKLQCRTQTCGMNSPSVQNQPCVNNNQRPSVQCHHFGNTITHGPGHCSCCDKRYTNVTLIDLLFPIAWE